MIPVEWKEAKMIILLKKGDTKDLKKNKNKKKRLLVYLPTLQTVHTDITKTNEKGF